MSTHSTAPTGGLRPRLRPEVHGMARSRLPALHEFLALLLARGTESEVRLAERPPLTYARRVDALV